MKKKMLYYQRQRPEIAMLLPRQYSKVLDIGCGAGKFRDNLTQENEYWGIEPVDSIAKIASEKLDKVLIGTYQEIHSHIPNDYFDLVICNDVIEHMPDHEEFFQSIKAKIKKDGCLIVSIPNVRYISNLFELLVKKDWEYKNRGILDRTHLRFFTKKSLIRTITDNGFTIVIFTGINSYRADSFFKRCIFTFAMLFLGRDVKFSQFCACIRIAQSSDKSPQPNASSEFVNIS